MNRLLIWSGAFAVAGGVTAAVLAGAGSAHAEAESGSVDTATTSQTAKHAAGRANLASTNRQRTQDTTDAADLDATSTNNLVTRTKVAVGARALSNADHQVVSAKVTSRNGRKASDFEPGSRPAKLVNIVVAAVTRASDPIEAIGKPRPIKKAVAWTAVDVIGPESKQAGVGLNPPLAARSEPQPSPVPDPVGVALRRLPPTQTTLPSAIPPGAFGATTAPGRTFPTPDMNTSVISPTYSAVTQTLLGFPAVAPTTTRTTSAAPLGLRGESTSNVSSALATQPSAATGVTVGHSDLTIPYGPNGYTTAADWYFPTQADGSVQPNGVIWLQHGFLGDKSWYSALATDLARRTNSVVVAPNVSSFPQLGCPGCTLNSAELQQATATMFLGERTALNTSAAAAGFEGSLPEKFILTGHSAGGGFATAVAGYAVDNGAAKDSLLGVVMLDGVSSNGTFGPALASLDAQNIPVYQIAAPPQPWNARGATTNELVALRPDEFTGVTLANGSHVDSLIGGVPLIDFIAQLVIKRSPPGNTAAVYTLADGWINDMYAGKGPDDPRYGLYGAPGQQIILGPATAFVLAPPPTVDVNKYLGTWYEVGSVKQFFSIGLVNTKAVYNLNPDGSIRVENSGNYFFSNGPRSAIVGSAVPLNPDNNNKLNVRFFGPPSATPPGNYWIVDLAPDYSWVIVTDSTGSSGFLLSRSPTISDDLYKELVARATAKGVTGPITRTRQPAAQLAATTV